MLKKVPYLKTGIFLLIVILSGMKVCFAEDNGRTLVNENFETGYIDRGDVHSNLLLSEHYDAFADQNKCGYMVYQQVTGSNYPFDSGDRAGYDASERLHAGYHEKYGNLGSAIYLYPDFTSNETDWWISAALNYDQMNGIELYSKKLDINFLFADSGESGRAAKIWMDANINGVERTFLIGIKSVQSGVKFLNSYHKRVRFCDVLEDIPADAIVDDVRIRLSAPKGTAKSIVKIDDIHIREVD